MMTMTTEERRDKIKEHFRAFRSNHNDSSSRELFFNLEIIWLESLPKFFNAYEDLLLGLDDLAEWKPIFLDEVDDLRFFASVMCEGVRAIEKVGSVNAKQGVHHLYTAYDLIAEHIENSPSRIELMKILDRY
jgi:hypothetical protein